MSGYASDENVSALAARFGQDQGQQDDRIATAEQAAADAVTTAGAADAKAIDAQRALSAPYQPFADRAAAQASSIPAPVTQFFVGDLGYRLDPAGTAMTTADGKKWSPLGVATPQHWGAVGDGVADSAEPFEAAFQYAIERDAPLRGEGIFTFSRPIAVNAPGHLSIDFSSAVLDFSAAPANTNITLGDLIQFSGTKGTAVALTADATSWEDQGSADASKLTVASAAGFTVGDLIFVEDDSLIYSDDTAKRGELARVAMVTATEIHLHDALKMSYSTASAARVSKIDPIKVTGNLGTVVGGGAGGAHKGLVLRCSDSPRIVANIEGCESVGLELQYCYAGSINATVRDATLTPATSPLGKTGYGVLIGAGCRHCDVGIIATNCSHAVAGGGLHSAMQIKVRGHAVGCGLGYPAWDAHEECFDWTFDVSSTGGNGGLTYRGRDASIRYRGRECKSSVVITNNGYNFTQGRIHLDLIDVDNHGSIQIGSTGDQPITEVSFGVIRASRVRFVAVNIINALSVRGDTIDARGFRAYSGDADTSFRLLHLNAVGDASIGRLVLKDGKHHGLTSNGGKLRIGEVDIGTMPKPTDLSGLTELIIDGGKIESIGSARAPAFLTSCSDIRISADLIGDISETTQDGLRGVDCNNVRLIGARVIAGRHAAYISGAASNLQGVGCDFSGVSSGTKLNAPDTPVSAGNIV